ncbi:MAG: hypothetical protein ACOYME_05140 [Prochlorotrichaceae cyanobacterium]|jgi:hypothetical protein
MTILSVAPLSIAPPVSPTTFQENLSYDHAALGGSGGSSRLGATPRCADSMSSYGAPRWSTLRFRRAKDHKGWVLLAIPLSLYPLVVQRLFEHQAKFISKHRNGAFVNLLFEAPQALVSTLALTFPAPPGCDPLE